MRIHIALSFAASFVAIGVFIGPAAHAELVVSGNDGHQPDFAAAHMPDSVAVVDFTNGNVKTLGIVMAPASIIGPPLSVAVAPGEKMALVTGGTKADPADATKTVTDDVLSVIDISDPTHPKVSQSLHAGQGAAGVAINRAGTLALVANTNEDSVSIYTIAGGKLTDAGKLALPAGARPNSITFLPDGRGALLLCQGAPNMTRLTVNGSAVNLAGPVGEGLRATIAMVTPDSRFAIINGGVAPAPGAARGATPAAGAAPVAAGAAPAGRGAGGAPREAMASLVDLSSGAIVASAALGAGPEYIGLSPDGTYLEATITNGSHGNAGVPPNSFGLIKVYKVTANAITPVAQAQTGHWCQGAVWSRDNHALLLQCGIEKEIELFRFDGAALTRDAAATLKFDAGPAGIASASSH